MGIVGDFRTLNGMERKGLVKLHGSAKSRERHWSGAPVRVLHVDAGDKLKNEYQPFTYRGKQYRLQYFDGCFYQFVVTADTPRGGFV